MDAYEGYEPAIEWDASIGERFGHVRDIADTITFRGATGANAAASFRESVDDHLAWCAEDGNPPCLPAAGLDARLEAASTPETKRHALDNLKSTLVARETRGEITAKAMTRGIEALDSVFDAPEEPR